MGCFAPGTGGALCVWVCGCCVCVRTETSGGHGHTTPETVVLGMSGRRTGSVFARDRCDREE